MQHHEISTDVQTMLFEWARWRVSGGGVDIGYPSQTAFSRMMRPAGYRTSTTSLISDEMAGTVDLAVSRLKIRCLGISGDFRFEAVTDCYLLGKTDAFIARRLKCDRRTIQSARKAGESWIDSHMVAILLD